MPHTALQQRPEEQKVLPHCTGIEMAPPVLVVPELAGEPPSELRPPWVDIRPPDEDEEPPDEDEEPPVAPPPSPRDEVTPPQAESASTTHPISHR
jgi:hypothetical protein